MVLLCNNLVMRINSGDKNLADRIKQIRREKNLTQEQLAELANVSLPLIQKIERVATFGSKNTHEKLANALGVSVQFLLFGTEEKPKSRIPDLPPDPPLEPELLAAINDPRLGGIFYSKPYMSRLSNAQLRQIALDALTLIKEIEDFEASEK